MTFHGKPRASHDVMHHAHESPPVMLVPLFMLAAGALFAGVVFHDYFIGEDYAEFWKASLFTLPDNHILHEIHDVPLWVKLAPFVAMLIGFVRRLAVLHPSTRRCRSELAAQHAGALPVPAQQVVLRRALRLHLRAAGDVARPRPLEGGDGWLIDGFGPDGVSARVLDVTARVVRLQTGYLYHYAFAMLIGVAALLTWVMFGGGALMIELADPLRRHLPAAGRRAADPAHARRRRGGATQHARWIALWTTLVTFLAVAADLVGASTPPIAGFQFVEKLRWLGGAHRLPHGRRRHLDAVRHPDRPS